MMKRTLMLLVCLALLCAPSPAALAGDYGYVVNNPNPADRLHLRVQPGENAQSLGKYYNGTPVTFLGEDPRWKGWYKVRVGGDPGGLEGYMNSQFLTGAASAGISPNSAMPEYMSLSSVWQLYDQPSAQGPSREWGFGEGFLLMGFTPDWWHIRTRDGRASGFVRAKGGALSPVSTLNVFNQNPADRLHLRVKPDKAAASLGKYYNGVTVVVLSYVQDITWAQVRIGPLEGYMDTRYLGTGGPGSVKSAIPTGKVKVPQGQHLQLRQLPSEKSPSLGRFPNGTAVRVYGVSDAWCHVQVDGKEGFMMTKFLDPRLP